MKQFCSNWFTPPSTATECHLRSCRAQCSECYYSKVCLPGKSKHAQSCCLGSKYGPQEHNKFQCGVGWLGICQSCVRISITGEIRRGEARDTSLIRHLAGTTDACTACGALMQNNKPLWWVCSKCSCECQDHIHPPWIERTDL